jgi:hypothetical protein
VLALVMTGAAQTPSRVQPVGDLIGPLSHIQPPADTYRAPAKETYFYSIDWRLWTAGTATLRLDVSGTQYHVTGTAESAGVVSLLYRVHDRFESWFDSRTFCSQEVQKRTQEGLRSKETNIHFDYARRKAVLDETDLKKGQKKHAEEDIPGCVTDVLSGIYYMSSLPLQNGATYVFPMNDGGKTVDVRITPDAREQVKTDAGTFQTIRVQVEANTGPLKDRGKAWIWVTDDAQHTPIMMRARMFWGTLTMKLQRVEKQ